MKNFLIRALGVSFVAFWLVTAVAIGRLTYQVGEIMEMEAANMRLETAIYRQETANMRLKHELEMTELKAKGAEIETILRSFD